jgi:hypothetical protein
VCVCKDLPRNYYGCASAGIASMVAGLRGGESSSDSSDSDE